MAVAYCLTVTRDGNSGHTPQGVTVSELALMDGAQRVPVPYGRGNDWVCPACEQIIPPTQVRFLGKPPRYAHLLNDVIRCTCGFIFSPRSEALVLRR